MNTDSNKFDEIKRENYNLPEVIDIKFKYGVYIPPRLKFFQKFIREKEECLIITVKTKASIPVRGLSPKVFIGNYEIIEGKRLSDDTYEFYGFEYEDYKEKAPIYFGWSSDEISKCSKTNFIYVKPRKKRKKK